MEGNRCSGGRKTRREGVLALNCTAGVGGRWEVQVGIALIGRRCRGGREVGREEVQGVRERWEGGVRLEWKVGGAGRGGGRGADRG